MTATVNLLAPGPYLSFQTRNGNFTSDVNSLISGVTAGPQVLDLIEDGCIALSFNPYASPRDFIDCGDFGVNPFQRNIPGLASGGVISAAIAATPTYFADRFSMVGGASSAILASLVADSSLVGYNQCLKMSRQSGNTNTAPTNTQHVIETMDSYRAQGQTMTLSLFAKLGANYSGGPVSVQVAYGTGVNQSAALLASGSWAAQANALLTTQVMTNGWVRYQWSFLMPANASQIGIQVGYTPSGTAGADDSISFQDWQLEIGATASQPERLDAQITLEIAQRFAWVTPEPAAGVVVGAGMNPTASTQLVYMATPVQFIKAPTVTVSAGSFKTNQANTATATTVTPGATHTANAISVNGNSAGTAGSATMLQGGGGAGWILASADF